MTSVPSLDEIRAIVRPMAPAIAALIDFDWATTSLREPENLIKAIGDGLCSHRWIADRAIAALDGGEVGVIAARPDEFVVARLAKAVWGEIVPAYTPEDVVAAIYGEIKPHLNGGSAAPVLDNVVDLANFRPSGRA